MLGTMAPSSVPVLPTPLSLWEPQAGDRFVVDTRSNMGYLVHEDGQFTSFEVATGQRRFVRYIGRSYNATTPTKNWTVKSLETKGDRVTFGESGKFFRLYDEGEKTAYGIHTYRYEDNMFALKERYGSMGCIIIRKEQLPLIEQTFEINGSVLDVTTTYGFDTLIASAREPVKE